MESQRIRAILEVFFIFQNLLLFLSILALFGLHVLGIDILEFLNWCMIM